MMQQANQKTSLEFYLTEVKKVISNMPGITLERPDAPTYKKILLATKIKFIHDLKWTW